MEINRVKTAVVGCGMISEAYIKNLKNRFYIIDLVACSDLNTERMKERAGEFGIKAMGFDDILASGEIELVINLTNPQAHYAITKSVLEAGKNVYSEKTMASDFSQAKELCRIADKKKLHLGVSPDTFLGATVQTARELIEKGAIGKPLSFVASLTRDYEIYGELLPHLRQKGGSLCYDTGCYYLTALCSLLGPVSDVFAFETTNERERIDHRLGNKTFGESYAIEVENVAALSLRLKNGVLGTFHLNSDCIFRETRILKIYGTEGIISIDDPNRFESPLYLQKPFSDKQQIPVTHGYENECRGIGAAEMAWSIRTNRLHRASKEMACHVLEICAGMDDSARTGQLYKLETDFKIPDPLPMGYIARPEYGIWAPTEETALSL
jgi:predicted dehydrogenase